MVPSHSRCRAAVVMLALTSCAAVAEASGPLVGAYYYPWWGPGGHSWTLDNNKAADPEELRLHLSPQQAPAAGLYDSDSAATIATHITQSHQANISFWALSWSGQNSTTDKTIRNSILPNPRAGELKYAIHYETSSRLGSDPTNADYSVLTPDFTYLAQTIFSNPNYLRLNGRPVVFMYLTRTYFNGQSGAAAAVASLRSTMKSQFGYDPYIVGDDCFGTGLLSTSRAKLWDAVTDFDVYGSFLQSKGSTSAGVALMASKYDSWKSSANALGVGFVPTVSPGFNDSAYPGRNHVPAPRYLTDAPTLVEGSLFSSSLQSAVADVDALGANMLLVNSFNEWHEDTQIEPTVVTPPDSTADGVGSATTGGFTYSGYGDMYLNLLHDATAMPEPSACAVALLLAAAGLLRRRRNCQQ